MGLADACLGHDEEVHSSGLDDRVSPPAVVTPLPEGRCGQFSNSGRQTIHRVTGTAADGLYTTGIQ